MEYQEQLKEWFDKYCFNTDLEFDGLETKYNECKQVSALVFMASKLKNKSESYFIHGEHDMIYIGSDLDRFEEFTEEEVKIACAHGIDYSEHDDFTMYASM